MKAGKLVGVQSLTRWLKFELSEIVPITREGGVDYLSKSKVDLLSMMLPRFVVSSSAPPNQTR